MNIITFNNIDTIEKLSYNINSRFCLSEEILNYLSNYKSNEIQLFARFYDAFHDSQEKDLINLLKSCNIKYVYFFKMNNMVILDTCNSKLVYNILSRNIEYVKGDLYFLCLLDKTTIYQNIKKIKKCYDFDIVIERIDEF